MSYKPNVGIGCLGALFVGVIISFIIAAMGSL